MTGSMFVYCFCFGDTCNKCMVSNMQEINLIFIHTNFLDFLMMCQQLLLIHCRTTPFEYQGNLVKNYCKLRNCATFVFVNKRFFVYPPFSISRLYQPRLANRQTPQLTPPILHERQRVNYNLLNNDTYSLCCCVLVHSGVVDIVYHAFVSS